MIYVFYIIIAIVVVSTMVFVAFGTAILISEYKRTSLVRKTMNNLNKNLKSIQDINEHAAHSTITYQIAIPVFHEAQQTTVSVSSGRSTLLVSSIGNGQPLPTRIVQGGASPNFPPL